MSALAPAPSPRGLASPMLLQPILGREGEIDVVLARLDDAGTRLLTLLGPGGVGKTRLALEIARRAEGRYAHGARIAFLAAITDPDLFPAELARALDIRLDLRLPVMDQVIAELSSLHLLLVLDNLEQVAAGVAPGLARLVQVCPRLTVLSTSRAPLRVSGEVRYEVEPLPVSADPAADHGPAVDLLLRQARALRPDVGNDARTLDTVAAICRAVDGLPLAIELAAARMRHLSPAAVLDRLQHRFDLLANAGRGAPARQRSLRDTIAWSYDLLPAPAQVLLCRLGVFTGGFDIEAVEQVSAGLDTGPGSALGNLSTLVEHHLVRQVSEGDDSRYTMLATIREFALDALVRSGGEAAARDAHAGYFLDLAARLGPLVDQREAGPAVARLRAEWPNFRAAATWLANGSRVDDAVDMYVALFTFAMREGRIAETRDAFDALLESPHMGERARNIDLLRSGSVSAFLAEYSPALARMDELVATFRASDDRANLAFALIKGISEPDSIAEIERRKADCEEALALARDTGQPGLVVSAMEFLVWACAALEQPDESAAWIERWLTFARANGMAVAEANATTRLAEARLNEGKLEEAQRLFRQAAAAYHRERTWFGYNLTMIYLANMALDRGGVAEARAVIEPVVRSARERGIVRELAPALGLLAEIMINEGDHAGALPLAQETLCMMAPSSTWSAIGGSFDTIARIAARTGDARTATLLLGASDALLRRFENTRSYPAEMAAEREVMAAATRVLGEAGYQATLAEGTALERNEVVALAAGWRLPGTVSRSPGETAAGQVGLSAREVEVLRLMSDGLSNPAIGRELGISSHTATAHVSRILERLAVNSRTAAVAWAIRNHLA